MGTVTYVTCKRCNNKIANSQRKHYDPAYMSKEDQLHSVREENSIEVPGPRNYHTILCGECGQKYIDISRKQAEEWEEFWSNR
jgi:DNA-directed RNA polymerase subunit M/transcription elongation factor TFIIS